MQTRIDQTPSSTGHCWLKKRSEKSSGVLIEKYDEGVHEQIQATVLK